MRDQAPRMPMPTGTLSSARTFASVTIHRDAGTILEDWEALERNAPCSIYQTRAWLLPWADTLGRQAGVSPLFGLARGADGRAVALLCLGLSRRGPIRVATWLGGKDANFAMPLFGSGQVWSRDEIWRLLRETARAAGRDAPDAFVFVNQPHAWNGLSNPLAALPWQTSPSAAQATALLAEADTLFFAKLSKDARKKLRKKEVKLGELGPISHRIAATDEDRAATIDAFLALRAARFRQQGIRSDVETPAMRAFLERAATATDPGIELHALRVGDRVVAVYGGAAHAGQWSGMVTAFDTDDAVARSSPGDLLLMRVVADCCARGIRRFDLGVGEARYKAALCDEPIALFDTFVAVSARGFLYARLIAARQAIKRAVKGNDRLFGLVKRLRRLRARSAA